jgi:hypothetical protein
MNISRKFAVAACGLMMAASAGIVWAQAQPGGPGGNGPGQQQQNQQQAQPPTQYQVEQEIKQVMADIDDPNFDEAKLPKLIQQGFQDVRAVVQSMDPDQAQQWRMNLMQPYFEVMQRNQAKIQKAMQTAFLLNLQEPMGASDDEFAAILPALEKVADAQRESDGGAQRFRFMFRQPGQTNQPPPNQQLTPVDQAATDLQTTLDDPNSSDDLVKNKVEILREAKAKAKQDLTVAQDNLRSLLTVRQEAVLVMRGFLE